MPDRAFTLQKLIDTASESFDAYAAWLEAAQERVYRASRALLEEARTLKSEQATLLRAWVTSPASVYENLTATIDVQSRRQHRALDLIRDALKGAEESAEEVRDALRRMIRANRAGAEALLELGRAEMSSAARQANRVPRRWAGTRLPTSLPTKVAVREGETPAGLASAGILSWDIAEGRS